MKKLFTVIFLSFTITILGDWGFYYQDRSYVGINFNGTPTTYKIFDNGVVTGAGYFNGSNLGTLTSVEQTISISFWDIKTFKNSGSDVQQAQLYYRVYESGQSGGTFTQDVGGFLEDLGSGNQKWGKSTSTSVNLGTLSAGKTYILEIYIQVYGTSPDEWKYDNNSGSNYKATFTTDNTYPVELTTFSALVTGNNVKLNWETATEVNNYGFEIQRSVFSNQNSEWEKVGFVEGHGNSNSPKVYTYSDNLNTAGKYLYRLKQIDIDGLFEYSESIEIFIEAPKAIKLGQNYPNPFNPVTVIQFSLPKETNVKLVIYNEIGEKILQLIDERISAGIHQLSFDGSKLNSGIYFYQLETEDFVQTRKMLLIK